MPTSAVVLSTANTDYLSLPLGQGPSAIQRLVSRLVELHGRLSFQQLYLLAPESALPAVADIFRSGTEAIAAAHPGGALFRRLQLVAVPSAADGTSSPQVTAAAAWQALFRVVASQTSAETAEDHELLCLWIDQPFVATELASRLLTVHRNGWCDYTFADGYPIGYGLEIVRHGVLPALAELASGKQIPFGRSALFDSIAVDINSFDIETEVADHDYSLLREPLTCDTRRSYRCCDVLAGQLAVRTPAADAIAKDEDPVLQLLRTSAAAQRTVVNYLNVQITCSSPQRPNYDSAAVEEFSPCAVDSTPMSAARFEQLVAMVAAVNPEATIAVGYRGEPAMHPDITALIAAVEATPRLQLYLETCGVGWKESDLHAMEEANLTRTTYIVLLDAVDPNRYREIRGAGYEEAHAFARRMLQRYPAHTYVQAVRTRETIEEVEAFYRHWKALTPNVIIQKYNDFAGLLPARRVADLSPLHRNACRHLQRDLTILRDGTVVQCMQDLRRSGVRGNVFALGIEEVWRAGAAQYAAHLRGTFEGICGVCDEYYTFNA